MKNKNIKRCIALFCTVLMIVNLCGFSLFNSTDPVLYTENRKVYETYSADSLISAFVTNYDSAKRVLDEKYVAVLGRIYSKESDVEKIYLGSPTEMYGTTIECRLSDKGDIDVARYASRTDYVLVYGELGFSSFFGDKTLKLSVDKIRNFDSSIIPDKALALTDGSIYDKAVMPERTLANGRIRYQIPAGWAAVETPLRDVEGYQYRLNEQSVNFRVEPESVFVFFFDNNRFLLNLSDKGKTGRIEDAIIENILQGDGSDGKKKEKESHYGIDFDYYTTYFRNNLNIAYNVEFVFSEMGDDGFLVFLYVFNEQVHTDEIRACMRTAEID